MTPDETARLVRERHGLRSFTVACRDTMHEPDEQDISAHVVGCHLDNACGSHIDARAVTEGFQELVVVLKSPGTVHRINLADLIALARLAEFPRTS